MSARHRLLLLFLGDASTDRRVQSFLRFFRSNGWDVELLTLQPGALSGPRRFVSYDRRLKKKVRAMRTDVVMACDLYSLGAAVSMKRHGHAKYVIYDAREVYTELPTVAHRPLVKSIWKRYERRYIDRVDLMLVTGPRDADAIRRVHSGIPRTVLVRNLPWSTTISGDRSLLARHGLDPKMTTLVYVGGLQKGRGLEAIIRAMHDVEAQLLIVGGGVLDRQLRELAGEFMVADRVKFAGAVSADQALELTAACDVGVSLIEPISKSYELALPSKIFEYMMVGIPVLSSHLIQVTELFEKEEWIEFVNVRDIDDVTRGIRALATKSADAKGSTGARLREREQELAYTIYHFEADATRLLEVLQSRNLQ